MPKNVLAYVCFCASGSSSSSFCCAGSVDVLIRIRLRHLRFRTHLPSTHHKRLLHCSSWLATAHTGRARTPGPQSQIFCNGPGVVVVWWWWCCLWIPASRLTQPFDKPHAMLPIPLDFISWRPVSVACNQSKPAQLPPPPPPGSGHTYVLRQNIFLMSLGTALKDGGALIHVLHGVAQCQRLYK